MQRFSAQHQPRKDPEGDYGLIAEFEEAMEKKDEKINELENDVVQTSAIYEAISDILRDGTTSDFMMSFPIVSKISAIRDRACCLPSNEWGHTKDCVREQIAAFKATVQENAKYKAFWDQSRIVDRMNFEEYVWKEEER